MDAAELQVEIVFAIAEEQLLLEVTVAAGATIADVIEKSKLTERLPEYDLDALEDDYRQSDVPTEVQETWNRYTRQGVVEVHGLQLGPFSETEEQRNKLGN